MASPAVGSVVLVRFPFSDLGGSKFRPAVVLADAGRGDCVLCQITSNPYADGNAVELHDADFLKGGLQRVSFVRPGKLFTANAELIAREVGHLKPEFHRAIIEAVEKLLRKGLMSAGS